MQLTRFTDLGLRAMMLLAAAEHDGRRVTTGSIATNVNASEHHIAKAVTQLVALGLVQSQRGRTGGLSLTAEGHAVSIGHIVRRLEGDTDVIDCVGNRPCPLLPACRLRRALADASEAFYVELDKHTVDDLTNSTVFSLVSLLPMLPN